MIVEVHELQAFKCTSCGRIYEIERGHGSEEDLNRKLDYKRRLQQVHESCKPRAEVKR